MPYRATSGLHLAAQNGDVAALQRLLSHHLCSLSATFVPKFQRLPAEIVPLIVQFWAHVGDY